MRTDPWHWLPINDDVDAEFHFWKSELLASLRLALLFAVATGTLIAVWPSASVRSEAQAFVHDYWTYFVEAAFWLGYLVGLLWGAGKRLGAALAGSLPWEGPGEHGERAATARFFGQWAAFFALAGVCLWFAREIAVAAEAGLRVIDTALAPVQSASFLAATVFALLALRGRRRQAAESRQNSPQNNRQDSA